MFEEGNHGVPQKDLPVAAEGEIDVSVFNA
jgi:hypothetical protein